MVNFLEEAKKFQDVLVKWRRELHQIPEVGICLPQTVKYVTEQLEEMDISYKVYEDISCVEAIIGTGSPCFLLRSDMDALQVVEEADISFKSENGCMHGCGHDLHAAILLGAAKMLKECEDELKGSVKLLFQSGEEIFKGAKGTVERGILENPQVDSAFAGHVIAAMPMGVVMTGKQVMSSVYGFKIVLTGKGGHGSMPEETIDPINAAVQVYLALQSLIAREVGGTEEAILTIGQLYGGDVANVIPERAVLQGTLRTFRKEVRERLIARIHEMVPAVASAYRCKTEIEVLSDCPSVITDYNLTSYVEEVICNMLPEYRVMGGMQGMGSEDFAEITDRVPGAYFMFGAGVPDNTKWVGQHNPKVLFNEDILPIGAAVYAQVAMNWLEKNS